MIPNFSGTAVDVMLCNVDDPNSNGVVHYAYTVGAEKDAIAKRTFPWVRIQGFEGEYGHKHPTVVKSLENGKSYRPGEGVLDSHDGSSFVTNEETIMRLGALELLANLSSGRLSTTDKDPFPHQLALQQYLRRPPRPNGLQRLLIADEVGLGKTIEVGLILRDVLLAKGSLEGFSCLYLTSGGLVEDAANKLRDVLSGVIDGVHIVSSVASFREYGNQNTFGVHVASMHAARLYVSQTRKKDLPKKVAPQYLVIDECHHAASDGDLAGTPTDRQNATQTYIAARQLMSGEFWEESKPPQLGILMSATPFRSGPQFVNLLRLLTHGVDRDGKPFGAYEAGVQASELRTVLQDQETAASVVWRRQTDASVRSWIGHRIFPNLKVVRPHQIDLNDPETPRLSEPSAEFLALLTEVKSRVKTIANAHGQGFGGFATAQMQKKLTSSSLAGACWLFSWAVRHCEWSTQKSFENDKSDSTNGLRKLVRRISKRIAAYDSTNKQEHATVVFPNGFKFEAVSLAQGGAIVDI